MYCENIIFISIEMAKLFPLKWCCTDTAFEELIKNTTLTIFLVWHMICALSTHTSLINQYHIFLTFRKKFCTI